MKKKSGAIEFMKTLLIVILTLSAVFLVTYYWEAVDYAELLSGKTTEDEPVQTMDAPKAKEVIFPASIRMYNVGKGKIRTLDEKSEIWEDLISSLAAFTRSENAGLEITHKEIIEDSKTMRYIAVEFGYSLPFDGFCKQFGLVSQPFEDVEEMTALYYFENIPESLFLIDEKNESYYRLTGNADSLETFRSLFNDGEEKESDGRIYILKTEADEEERNRVADTYAKSFFDNSFDFVRRVEDSQGTLTFMYGYSEKVLTITKEGIIEYKEELKSASVTQGFYASLGTALSYTASHGGWYPEVYVEGNKPETTAVPYLISGESIETKSRKGYRYCFGYDTSAAEMDPQSATMLIVEVYDGQVTYYKRNFLETISLIEGEAETEEE